MIIFNILAGVTKSDRQDSEKERKLIKLVNAGDTRALEQLYELYKSLLFGMIISIVKKREEAEDVLQEVFITIWEKANTFDPDRGNVFSWIVTLSRNKAIDRIRSKGYKNQQKTSLTVEALALSSEADTYDPLETTIFSDRAELVKEALKKIPETQSEVIKIAYYTGMTQSEIADHLDLPLGTVKTRTRQGMIKLKEILQNVIAEHG